MVEKSYQSGCGIDRPPPPMLGEIQKRIALSSGRFYFPGLLVFPAVLLVVANRFE
jgi:hypothetical protein